MFNLHPNFQAQRSKVRIFELATIIAAEMFGLTTHLENMEKSRNWKVVSGKSGQMTEV